MKISELMQKTVVTVSPELPVEAFEELLNAEGISGAPVVGDQDLEAIGVASKTDIIRVLSEERSEWVRDLIGSEFTVADIMTEDPVITAPGDDVAHVARTMIDGQVHRVLVVEGGELVGIVTPFDLLSVIAAEK